MFRRNFVSSLLVALLTAHAALSSVSPAAVRVALFVGGGTSNHSSDGYAQALDALRSQGITYATCGTSDVEDLSRDAFDVVLFPGGSGGGEYTALTQAGTAAVRAFVHDHGGGYIGTCAGGFLAVPGRCCDVPMKGYCGDKTGCSQSTESLSIISAAATEPWDRGHGNVTIEFTSNAIEQFHLPDSYRSPVNIVYWQGPILRRWQTPHDPSLPAYTSQATYHTEIHSKHTEWTKGQMVNTSAIVTSSYGSGRVLVSSPHPEQTQPQLLDLILGYVRWAAGVY